MYPTSGFVYASLVSIKIMFKLILKKRHFPIFPNLPKTSLHCGHTTNVFTTHTHKHTLKHTHGVVGLLFFCRESVLYFTHNDFWNFVLKIRMSITHNGFIPISGLKLYLENRLALTLKGESGGNHTINLTFSTPSPCILVS